MILYRTINGIDYLLSTNDEWVNVSAIKMEEAQIQEFHTQKDINKKIMEFPESYNYTIKWKSSIFSF